MTGTELITLGRRAVACKHWRWMAGMAAKMSGAGRQYRLVEDADGERLRSIVPGDDPLPDLSDHGTLGCVLELVRRAWGDDKVSAVYHLAWEQWVLCGGARLRTIPTIARATEAEALVAALEAAP